MGDRRNRAFHYAVLLSIALHAVILLASPSLREAARRMVSPEPIVARLVESPPAVAPEPPQPAPQPPAKPPAPSKPPPVAKAAPTPTPVPAPAPAEPAPPPSTEQPAAPPSPPAAPATAAAPAAPAPAAPAARPGADIDADTVGRYRMLVIEAARKLKRYPRAARDNNWEGRTNVRVNVGADGRRSSVTVARSSGHEILDREALDTVTRADVPVPSGLRGKAFAFEIEVVFSLEERG